VPALAPLHGLIGLAGAFPALAGRARSAPARGALGALGAWWTLLAAPLLGRELLGGGGSAPAVLSDPSTLGLALTGTEPALNDVIGPLVTSGALLYAVVWALAALVLPWLVRGRWLAADLVAASIWAAALGAATAAISESIDAPEPNGLVLGSVVAGVVAVAVPHLRTGRVVEP
jgi:hypothetical protein